jgi:hypothetical protein
MSDKEYCKCVIDGICCCCCPVINASKKITSEVV